MQPLVEVHVAYSVALAPHSYYVNKNITYVHVLHLPPAIWERRHTDINSLISLIFLVNFRKLQTILKMPTSAYTPV